MTPLYSQNLFEKIINIHLIPILLIAFFVGMGPMAFTQTTASFESLSYSEDFKITPISTVLDGFVFTGKTSGSDVGMRFSKNLGESSSKAVYADYDEGSVDSLDIVRDGGGAFSLTSMWVDAGGFGSYEVAFYGYRNGTKVYTKSNLDIASAITVPFSSWSNLDLIRIVATDQANGSYDVAATIDNIVYTDIASNTTPTMAIASSNLNYTENDAATQIDASATANDADGDSDWDGGTLTAQITANAESADELSIPDNIVGSINTDGTNLRNGTTVIGTLSYSEGTVTNGTMLTITFTSNVTNALVQQTLRALSYRNTSQNPGTSNRTVTVTATDANAASANDTRTISVTSVDDDTPTIVTNNGLKLDEGATKTIPLDSLEADDSDTENATLLFTVTSALSNGQLENTDNPGVSISSFTQQNLIDDKIRYVHDDSNTTSDAFTFKVADGVPNELTGQTFNITIRAVDDDTPIIATNNGLKLDEGATKTIPLDSLEADDSDTDNVTLTYTITSAPENGQLENTDNPGVSISSFTQQNLIDWKIQYVHNGSNTTSDVFTFKVADGVPNELTGHTFNIIIRAVDDDTPTIVTNNGLGKCPTCINDPEFDEGSTGAITLDLLEANDTDADNATLLFTVTSAPSNGQLENTDNAGNAISSFTQQNLIDDKIRYVHDGTNTTSDAFTFKVADGVPNELTGQTFSIIIRAVDDDTPTISTNNGLKLDEGATKTIPLDSLEADDTDTENATLLFTVTSAPENGQLENTDNPGVSISSFTQQNLIDDKIQYVHDDGESLSDQFIFKVADSTPNELTSQSFSITVHPINDNSPVVTASQSFNVDENAVNTTSVGTVMATDADAGTSFSAWTIAAGNTDAIFEIDESTGEITITDNTNLDYETTTSYTLSITVSDGVNNCTEENVTINVNPINDIAPIITCCRGFDIVENSDNGTSLGSVSASDDDMGDDTNFSAWTIVAGNEDGIFKIDESSGEIAILDNTYLDYERDASHNLILTVSDGVHTSAEESVHIQMYNENDEIPVITSSQSFNVDENSANATSLGTVLATDNDAGTSFSNWMITIGNTDGIFEIDESTGEITITDNTNLDYETTTSYTLSITVSDGLNTSATEKVTIDVNPINDNSPVVTASQRFNVDEDAANSISVGTVMATDADEGTSFSAWTINAGNTDGIFEIKAGTGEIKIIDNTNLDYETTTSYTLSITVSDGLNTSAPETLTIDVNPINDNTPVTTASQSFNVDEDAANSTSVGTVMATDNDAGTSFSAWTITAGNTDAIFEIDESTGEITIADNTNLDYETSQNYALTIAVSDGTNVSAPVNVAVYVNDVNDVRPIIQSSQIYHVTENSNQGLLIASIEATDGDVTPSALTFAWSGVGGNINSAFVLEPSSGEIEINNEGAIDREQIEKFELVFTVNDGVNTSAPEKVTIIVDDVNEFEPIIVSGQTFEIDENSSSNEIIGDVIANDGDAGTIFSNWTIVGGNEDEVFKIDDATGEISVTDNAILDYEAVRNYTLTITVSDGEKLSAPQSIFVNVINLNDNIPSIEPNQVYTIHENLHNGNSFAIISAKDEDIDAVLSDWKIISGNENKAFGLDNSNGHIAVNNSTLLDRETTESFQITITVSDGLHVSTPETIIIKLDDLNDNLPVVTPNQNFTIDENSNQNTSIGEVLVSDADITPTKYINWTITNMVDFNQNGNHAVSIDPNSGELKINDPEDFDCESNSSFNINVKVSDGTDYSAEEIVTINLNDVNEFAPVITADQTFTIDENSKSDVIVGTVLATDNDLESILGTWSIIGGNDENIFDIEASSGKIIVKKGIRLDYEYQNTYKLKVRLDDGNQLSEEEFVTINLNDINEAPIAISGDDQMVAGDVLVRLDGSNSTDPENDELTYHWTAPEEIILSDENSAQPTFTSPILNQNTNLTFTLVVNDGEFDSNEVTTTVNVELTTGIDDINSFVEYVQLYPNPTTGIFNISLGEKPTNGALVIISNLNGKIIFQEKFFTKIKQFNTSLAPDMYLVKIISNNKTNVHKLLIL